MKRYAILILFLISSLSYSHVHALKLGSPPGGCYPREDIETKIDVSPDIECLKIEAGPSCGGGVDLEISSYCDDALVYEAEGQKIELYNFEEIRKNNYDRITKTDLYYDKTIPQDYTSWQRELYYKDDPDQKIIIKGENVPVGLYAKAQEILSKYYDLILGAIILILISSIVGIIIIKKKQKK